MRVVRLVQERMHDALRGKQGVEVCDLALKAGPSEITIRFSVVKGAFTASMKLSLN